jgi:hypothetical protein
MKNNIINKKIKTFFESIDFDSNPVLISFSIITPDRNNERY